MHGDSPRPLTLARGGDLDVMRILAKIPKVPGRSVARRRALVDAMQLTISRPPPHCIPTEAESAKLARADHPVLALRDL